MQTLIKSIEIEHRVQPNQILKPISSQISIFILLLEVQILCSSSQLSEKEGEAVPEGEWLSVAQTGEKPDNLSKISCQI